MKKLSLLADENIPNLASLCAEHFDIKTLSGREISAADLDSVDALFVRSVTKVNAELLANSDVKFVGSATIGVDHIDIDYLDSRGIAFAHAPGSNANGVVDYVMSTLLNNYDNTALQNLTVAVVGHGNVGSRLVRCLRHFAINHLVYDPLYAFSDASSSYSNNNSNTELSNVATLDALMDSDVISIHVPLTHSIDSDYPTYHLFDAAQLAKLAANSLLINSSRGPVVDNDALKALLLQRGDLTSVLDVWETEPLIDLELLALCQSGTPHIAGYSLDGKHRGTRAIATAAFDFFDLPARETGSDGDLVQLSDLDTLDDYRKALSAVYNAKIDSDHFKEKLNSGDDIAQIFDAYRKGYPARREINYDG